MVKTDLDKVRQASLFSGDGFHTICLLRNDGKKGPYTGLAEVKWFFLCFVESGCLNGSLQP